MRILNSMKLHSNNADDGLILELVDGVDFAQDGNVCFLLKVGGGHEQGKPIDAATARAIMEMSSRTANEPWPVRKR